MSPLHYAVQNGSANIVRLLEQPGADIDAVTDYGRSVFMLAGENGHKDVLVDCINESSLKESTSNHYPNRACSSKSLVKWKNTFDVDKSSQTFST